MATATKAVSAPRHWVVLSKPEDRRYGGNTGYDDAPSTHYDYDSNVGNSKQIGKGDWLIVCVNDAIHGAGRIGEIIAQPGTKELRRCPVCHITKWEPRGHATPKYKCRNSHEFDEPEISLEDCTKYRASFDQFIPCAASVPRTILRAGCPKYIPQGAMQFFDFELIAVKLAAEAPAAYEFLNAVCRDVVGAPPTYLDGDAGEEAAADPAYSPSGVDERKRAMREIAMRRGQSKFRAALRERYGDSCVLTNCTLSDALEAAHINPYRGDNENNPENGLLLRADLQTLFDLDLLGINPETMCVALHPSVLGKGYDDVCGRKLNVATPPSAPALKMRWESFHARLGKK